MRTRALLLLVALLAGCAHGSASSPAPEAAAEPSSTAAPWYGDLRALAEEAARARGLTLTQRFEVVALDEAPFLELFRSFARSENEVIARELTRTFEAFRLQKGERPLIDPQDVVKQSKEAQQEEILAFYHYPSHRLVVRTALPPHMAALGDELRLTILAHEVGHVLQDQLGVARTAPATFDEAITLRAVLEGDATLTAVLVLGARKHYKPERAVERSRVTLRSIAPAQILELTGLSPALLAAAPLVRDLYVFPYLRGQQFVSDVYAAGGLELLNAVLARPPRRSDAILRPQAWLDGARPPLRPLAPDGGRLGAFLFRALLEECLGRSTPARPALDPRDRERVLSWVDASYEDDAWRTADGRLAWATAWGAATAKDAEVGDLLSATTPLGAAAGLIPTLPGGDAGETSAPRRIGGDVVERFATCLGLAPELAIAHHEGTVGAVAGGAAEGRRALADEVAHAARDAVPGPPLGARKVPDPSLALAFRLAGEGAAQGTRWSHARLGLALDLPNDAKVLPNPAVVLMMASHGVILSVFFSDDRATPKALDVTFNGLLSGVFGAMKRKVNDFQLGQKHDWRAIDLGWTRGHETEAQYHMDDRALDVSTRILDLCDQQAALIVSAIAFDGRSGAHARELVARIQGESSSPPLCAEP